jgi:two-component system sensor histidine kinase/response regulator
MGLALVDPSTLALVDLNERLAQMLGRSRAELAGLTWQSLTHPDDLAEDLRSLGALARGEIDLLERVKRCQLPGGSWVWVRLQVRRAAAPQGGDALNWVWVEPLAPGVRVYETLLAQGPKNAAVWGQAAERLRRVESTARVGFWDWDAKTGELMFSEGCRRLFGLPPGQGAISVKRIRSCIHPDDRERVNHVVVARARSGGPLGVRYRILLPDGTMRWIDSYGAAGGGARGGGRYRHVSGVCIEATEHVALALDNAELTRLAHDRAVAEERLRQAAEAADFGIFECDIAGRRAHWSPEAMRILGSDACDLPWGGDILPWVHADDVERVRKAFARAVDPAYTSEGQLLVEHRVVRPDGSVRWVSLRGRTHFESGQATRLYGVVLDQTERRVAEAQLVEHSQRLEAANSAKSAFLANMSHEIRTPLGVISGLAELLRRDAADARQRRRLGQLFHTCEHVLGLVNDILDLSKIEAGELALQPEVFRLGSVLDRVRRLFIDQAREKGLALGSEVAPALRALVLRGDALRLAQVLINLCGNAIKFTREGSVVVSIEALNLDAESTRLRFAVTDTGPGIVPGLRAQLFQPFVQGDITTSRRYGGTGLGLAICQRLVALMGGTLDVASEPGQGCRFFFELWLPRAEEAAEEADGGDKAMGALDLSGRRILLAEDHPLSQEILYEMLEPLGCEVVLASDGQEAVQLARAGHYDLILMDLQMPGVDGLDATRRIRELPAYRDTPVIALTANVFLEDRARCLAAGMNDHLGKPVTHAALKRALSRWLGVQPPAVTPAQPVDAAWLEALTALPGVQVDGAWRSSNEQLRAYRDLLLRFVQGQVEEVNRVRVLLEAGRGGAAREAAHALAGAAGMVGARAVMNTARAIERALALGQPEIEVLPLAYTCLAELRQLSDAVARLESPSEPAAPA